MRSSTSWNSSAGASPVAVESVAVASDVAAGSDSSAVSLPQAATTVRFTADDTIGSRRTAFSRSRRRCEDDSDQYVPFGRTSGLLSGRKTTALYVKHSCQPRRVVGALDQALSIAARSIRAVIATIRVRSDL